MWCPASPATLARRAKVAAGLTITTHPPSHKAMAGRPRHRGTESLCLFSCTSYLLRWAPKCPWAEPRLAVLSHDPTGVESLRKRRLREDRFGEAGCRVGSARVPIPFEPVPTQRHVRAGRAMLGSASRREQTNAFWRKVQGAISHIDRRLVSVQTVAKTEA